VRDLDALLPERWGRLVGPVLDVVFRLLRQLCDLRDVRGDVRGSMSNSVHAAVLMRGGGVKRNRSDDQGHGWVIWITSG